MAKLRKSMNIPIFIPHFGCPNDCVFCNQRKISGRDQLNNEEEIRQIIEESIETAGNREVEIAFFGGSFTGLDSEVQKAYLELAGEYVTKYGLKGIRMSTRPDYINIEIMDFLKRYPVVAIELGVQSMDEEVLLATKRNHSVKDVYKAVKLIKDYGIELGVQMMIGLPKDTLEKTIKTARELIGFEPATVRIYPTLVIEETELALMYKNREYKPLTLEEGILWTSKIMPMFSQAGIQIIRVGLQDNEGLSNGGYLSGPYHPAFKELVMDELVYRKVMDELEGSGLEGMKLQGQGNIVLQAGSKMYNRLIGHKKRNLERFNQCGISLEPDLESETNLVTVRGIEGCAILTFFLGDI